MGQEKHAIEMREQARYDAARRDGRRCPYCNNVIPYGQERGPNRECPACVGALKDY